MKKRNITLNIIFLVIVFVELLGRLVENINLEYFAKPLIMLWIAVYFLLNSNHKSFRLPVLLAFFFSWIGDMFLMFSGSYSNEMLFFAGVGGFFIAQLMYILVFLKYNENGEKGFLIHSPFWAIPLVGYLVGLYLFLLPGLEGVMKPIILIYAISLIGMSLSAFNRKGRVNHRSYQLVFLGSLFFVLSDSMIAINKFYFDDGFPKAGFWIMLTYITAQYMIMRGLILFQGATVKD